MYTYVYTYICMSIYVYLYIFSYVSIHSHTYLYLHVCMHAYSYTFIYACVWRVVYIFPKYKALIFFLYCRNREILKILKKEHGLTSPAKFEKIQNIWAFFKKFERRPQHFPRHHQSNDLHDVCCSVLH